MSLCEEWKKIWWREPFYAKMEVVLSFVASDGGYNEDEAFGRAVDELEDAVEAFSRYVAEVEVLDYEVVGYQREEE